MNGLSVIVNPERPSLDVVFVHGFKGHPERTWSHKSELAINVHSNQPNDNERPAKIARLVKGGNREHVYWPKHLLPNTLPSARVLVYGYDTNIRHSLGSSISKNTVYDIASDFLGSLEAERRSQPSSPIIFVAHSLGGIVVKEMLRRSCGFTSHHKHLCQIYDSTAALMFFGTPHGGADPRGFLGHIAEQVIRVAGFTVNEQIINTLLPTSERLRELRDEFGLMIVEDVSSCLGDSSIELTQHIAANHMEMCRFSGLHDPEYRKVAAAFEHIQNQIREKFAHSALPKYNSTFGEDQRQQCMKALWFQTIDSRHSTIKAAHAKTCGWLLNRSEYQDWLDINMISDHHGLLWIKGKPGSGKSTLVKFLDANARKERTEAVVISFFFNARGEDLEKSTLGMYRSLLYQLFKALPDLQVVLDRVGSTLSQDGDSCIWTIDDLQSLFAAAVQKLQQRRLICFIDALDECGEDQIRDLLAFIIDLGRIAISLQIQFSVFLSSRHYPHISVANGIQLILDGQEGHVQDIARYLNSELKIGRGRKVEAIKEEILRRASGIFLWVALVVKILNKEHDRGHIHALERRLREIPDGLDKLFEDILTRDGENIKGLILCLQWVLYAKRPLRREELYYAILSGTDCEALTTLSSEAITAQDMERFILSSSKGLAETTKSKAQTVQFIHESVRDFLLGKNGLNKLKSDLEFGRSQECLKQCCHVYMQIDTTGYLNRDMTLPAASSTEAKDLRELVSEKFPFLDYAVRNILFHANDADGHGISQEAFVESFSIGDWIKLDNLFERFQIRRHTSGASPLYIFAEKNLSNLVRLQMKRESLSDNAGERLEKERYRTPLNAALANPKVCENTIRALIVPMILISRDDGELQNILSESEIDCHRSTVEEIINIGSNFFAHNGQSLLGWAASCGFEDVVRLQLAKNSVDRDFKDNFGRTPLFEAASNGHEAIVELLLAANFQTKSGKTPIRVAVSNGYEALVKLSFAANANSNSQTYSGETPLYEAASNGHEEIVKLLLAANADPNKRIPIGTPLYKAASNGHEAIIKLLLAANADSNSQTENGNTPLYKAASNGHEEIVKLLLAANANPDLVNNNMETPLFRAVSIGHEAIVKLLLAANADLDLANNYGQTPLAAAERYRQEGIVRLLRAAKADSANRASR